MTGRSTKLCTFYYFSEEGRQDRDIKSAYDTLPRKAEKMPPGISERS
jgi:hypothetical protein